MDIHNLSAEERKVVGRKVKQLRKTGKVPANIFGKDVKSQAISVVVSDFNKVFSEAGETGIIEITVGKSKSPVLVANVQTHPVTSEILHIDFRAVNLKEKIEAQVPVEVVGEAPAEKQGLGILVQQTDEVTVEALPADLPEKFEVDVSKLEELGAAITVGDLPSSDKVKILDEAEKVIAKVEELQKEEVVVAPAPAEGEAGEGEAPAEGAAEGGEQKESSDQSESSEGAQE